MILKKTDNYTKFYRLFKAGILTQKHYDELKDKSEPYKLPKSFLEYTLDEYFCLINSSKKGDLSIIKFIFAKNKASFFQKMTIETYFGILKAIENEFAKVKRAFDSIQKPPLSSEAKQAGFDRLDFGDYGLIDYIAKRHSLTDEEASKAILGFVIMKMRNDAQVAMCEYRMQEILSNKYKKK